MLPKAAAGRISLAPNIMPCTPLRMHVLAHCGVNMVSYVACKGFVRRPHTHAIYQYIFISTGGMSKGALSIVHCEHGCIGSGSEGRSGSAHILSGDAFANGPASSLLQSWYIRIGFPEVPTYTMLSSEALTDVALCFRKRLVTDEPSPTHTPKKGRRCEE